MAKLAFWQTSANVIFTAGNSLKKTFTFFSLIFFLLFFAISEFNPLCKNTPNSNNFVIIAHRGGSSLAPENTLAAINKVLKYNIDAIEIDVHLTKDNVPVVIHDYTINRTTNGVGEIRKMNYKELIKYDAGSWFNKKYSNEKIPTLDKIIKVINGRCNLIIEIKGSLKRYPDIVNRVNCLIKKNEAESWCRIHTFNNKILKTFHLVNKNIKLQKLVIFYIPFLNFYFDTKPHFGTNILKNINAINIYYRFVNRCIVKFFHSKGIKVNVWTVNNIYEINRLRNFGVDGIITDIPNKIKR